jgi:hypothetical protein
MLASACSSSSSNSHPDGGTGGTGGSGGTDGSAGVKITVSGVATVHPLAALAGPTTLVGSMLLVAAIDPARATPSGPPAPLSAAALDTSATNCMAGTAQNACAYSLPMVDLSGLSLGLVGEVVDMNTGDGGTARQWVTTGTGIASIGTVNQHKADMTPLTGTQLFAVSLALEGKLVDFVNAFAPRTGGPIAHGALESTGFMIGQVVGRLSQGINPVAGATVTVGGTTNMDIIYPNDTFTGVGTSTNSTGLFLGVPKSATMVVGSFSITGPAGGGDGGAALTWSGGLSGSNPNSAFVIIFAADETNGGG